jgi:hypothetical protein
MEDSVWVSSYSGIEVRFREKTECPGKMPHHLLEWRFALLYPPPPPLAAFPGGIGSTGPIPGVQNTGYMRLGEDLVGTPSVVSGTPLALEEGPLQDTHLP